MAVGKRVRKVRVIPPQSSAANIKRQTKDDASHGCCQSELLLKELGAERYEPVDNNGIESAVENREDVSTVGEERLNCLQYSSETFSSQIQRHLVVYRRVRRRFLVGLLTMML